MDDLHLGHQNQKVMNTTTLHLAYNVKLNGSFTPDYERVLHVDSLKFVKRLHENFNERRLELLKRRETVQEKLDNGWKPNFMTDTAHIRESEWEVANLPEDLLDRRVEITGPVDRKMMINALNSGAKVFMADFEDSCSPNWENIVSGQLNLLDANTREISFTNPETEKVYALNDTLATLMVRPRGLHLEEAHLLIDGVPVSASIFDFGIYLFNNHKVLKQHGSGPYFYLPKLEHYLEARWWNDVIVFAQQYLGIPPQTIKATVLVETILASYQLHEILWELRDHSAGLNCGRWDYIFSFIKRFHHQGGYVFPDRDQVTMEVPFMKAYSDLVVKTCHKRRVHAMGGMAAQIPIKGDPEANEEAFAKVRQDKLREVTNGHDGTWVAHPGLVPVAKEIFDQFMKGAHQLNVMREDVLEDAQALIECPKGTITEAGVRKNINVGIQYLCAWLSGNGAAAINHLMEDAATAEISRTQLWQWLHNDVKTESGQSVDFEWYNTLRDEEVDKIKESTLVPEPWKRHLKRAVQLFDELTNATELEEFLTLKAYQHI